MSDVPFRILPRITDRNAHFWQGGRDGELRFQRCRGCGYFLHPPSVVCPKCLSKDIGIPSGLSELGVKEKDLRTMAENAQKDACGLTNPRCPSLEDVINIYKAAA